jgi:hypothetical protein
MRKAYLLGIDLSTWLIIDELHRNTSVGNHFFQTLAKMARRLKQVLAKLK